MEFIYEVPDELMASVEQYLSVQLRQDVHPVSKAQVLVRQDGHESPGAFFKLKLDELLHQIVNLYPTLAVKAQLDQVRAAQAAIREMAAVKVVR